MPSVGLEALDLSAPGELKKAEDLTAAVARALSGDGALHYRANVLTSGRQRFPSRAPHTNLQDHQVNARDLRGAADGVALRACHTSAEVYTVHQPEGDLARLLYEILEQFRVEALAPAPAAGVAANLRARFSAWSHEIVNDGLLESDLGLLIFATAQMCRARINLEPIEDRFNDYTEATRFGVADILGPYLVALRPAIHDQEAFATASLALIEALVEIVDVRKESQSGSKLSWGALAMIADNDPDTESLGDSGEEGASGGQSRNDYSVYESQFDRVRDANVLVPKTLQRNGREELDAVAARLKPLRSLLRRGVRTLFDFPVLGSWETELEEGSLDPRLLTRLIAGDTSHEIYRRLVPEFTPQAAVTFLIDCSGSMKSVVHDIAVLVDLFVRSLDEAGVAVEVLGYTTGSWNGGRCARQWVADGRPGNPGRLNETLHVVYKSQSTSWRRARSALGGLLSTHHFRESVDGEALAWAAGRLLTGPAPRRHLVLVCDGSPRDGATDLANGETYLERHLESVAAEIERSGAIHLSGVGIGHDLSTFMRNSCMVDPTHLLTAATARSVLKLLETRSSTYSIL